MLFLFQRIEQRRLEHKVGLKKIANCVSTEASNFFNLVQF